MVKRRVDEDEAIQALIKENSAVHAAKDKIVKAAEEMHDSYGVSPSLGWAIRRLRAARKRQAAARERLEDVRSPREH